MDKENTTQIMMQIGSVYGNVERQQVSPLSEPDKSSQESPIYLTKEKGAKIDFIRVMNAWYELGKVTDACGGRLTKKEYFAALGRAFNIDLTSYERDLSNSFASSVAFDKQTRIFDELRQKQVDLYNSK